VAEFSELEAEGGDDGGGEFAIVSDFWGHER
jgi:hypothetical protein